MIDFGLRKYVSVVWYHLFNDLLCNKFVKTYVIHMNEIVFLYCYFNIPLNISK